MRHEAAALRVYEGLRGETASLPPRVFWLFRKFNKVVTLVYTFPSGIASLPREPWTQVFV
jgi:hypothetical protein